jgi:hypothetical protein
VDERDIAKDREMCEKATKGPWMAVRISTQGTSPLDLKWDSYAEVVADSEVEEFISRGKGLATVVTDEKGQKIFLSNECWGDGEKVYFTYFHPRDAVFIAESRTALPFYIDLCEHLERMVKAASDLVWRVLRCCPPVSPKTCRRNARDCEKCIRDYLDTKAREGAKDA